jgi:demethylmenaquinone methyltransferase/2-methoxy-6-polyprenyl-1,4-benzoquinol methylase
MPLLDHFSILAPLYDRLIQIPKKNHLIDISGLPVSGRVLDAGGGTGRIAQMLVSQANQIVVADTSLKMLGVAKSKENLDVVGSEIERLPFPDECFERIVVVDAFHHFSDQSLSLSELWRVLIPGGRLVIEEPDIRHFSIKLVALAEKLALFRSHFIIAERIAAQLNNLGAQTSILRIGHYAWVIGDKIMSHTVE